MRNQRGQSMVETVIVLPVVMLLFLGCWFLKEMMDARMAAVEATRYITWESIWNARPNPAAPSIKSDATLKQELESFKLGKGLISVRGAKARRSVKSYAGSVSGEPVFTTEIPQFVENFFKNPDREATGSSVTPGTTSLPQAGPVNDVIQTIVDTGGDLSFALSDFVANMTNFDEEADKSVITTEVTYRVAGRSVFKWLGNIEIKQTGSILAHPYAVARKGNQAEYDEVFGASGVGDCFTGSGQGRIFDLWFVPTVPISGVDTAMNIGKCFFSELGNIIGIADDVPLLGSDLGFKIPDGTLKEYPEKHL